jgi:hypothetical protein
MLDPNPLTLMGGRLIATTVGVNRFHGRRERVQLMGEYGVLYPHRGSWGVIPEDAEQVPGIFNIDLCARSA